jgi:protein TonB
MRDGVPRALLLAFAASILLHVALFVVLPRVRELSALIPPPPQPLIAHLVEEASAEKPAGKPTPPAPPKPRPAPPKPRPAPPKPRPAPLATPARSPEPAPAPVPSPELPPSPLGAPPPAPQPAPGVVAPPPAPITAAPAAGRVAPGPPALDTEALERFRSGITRQAKDLKRYPRVAIDNGWEGDVRVHMSIGPDGRIAALHVARSSGYETLDRQALEMFRRAQPRVPVPQALRGRSFELELLAVYRLSGN